MAAETRCVFSVAKKQAGLCHHFEKKGFCKWGDTCKFIHAQTSASSSSSSSSPSSSSTSPPLKRQRPPPPSGRYFLRGGQDIEHHNSLLRRTLEESGYVRTDDAREADLVWTPAFPLGRSGSIEVADECVILHFPRSQELTHKSRLHVNVRRARSVESDALDFVPESFLLPAEKRAFLQRAGDEAGAVWIFKPQASGGGRGIFLCRVSGEESYKARLTAKKVVVSRYVDRPLLIHGVKFDLRLYVAMVGLGDGDVYLYRNGLVRFANRPYKCDTDEDLDDRLMHITNNALQNKVTTAAAAAAAAANTAVSPASGTRGNWSLEMLAEHIGCERFDSLVWPQLCRIARDTIAAARPTIEAHYLEAVAHPGTQRCFELFGFDVLLDTELRAWLLEVNSMPDMSSSTANFHHTVDVHHTIKSHMLADVLTLLQLPDRRGASSSPPSSSSNPHPWLRFIKCNQSAIPSNPD